MTSAKSSNNELNSFLALHVSEATDTYLRGLAVLSCELAYTVKELREKQKASLPKELEAVEPEKAPVPVAQKTLKKEVDDIKPKKAPAPATGKTSKKELDGVVGEVVSSVTRRVSKKRQEEADKQFGVGATQLDRFSFLLNKLAR